MEKMMITGMLLAGMFLFSFTQNKENREEILRAIPMATQQSDTLKPQATAKVRGLSPEENTRLSGDDPRVKIKDGRIMELTDVSGKVSTDTVIFIDAEAFSQDKKVEKPIELPSVKAESVVELDTTPTATYGSEMIPHNTQKGHCYAKCNTQDGKPESWREILCEEKITTDFVRKLVAKLKVAGDLAASVESDELTKEIRKAVWSYQTRNKLPIGNLNLATMEHLGLNP